jgi:hypothetical protein
MQPIPFLVVIVFFCGILMYYRHIMHDYNTIIFGTLDTFTILKVQNECTKKCNNQDIYKCAFTCSKLNTDLYYINKTYSFSYSYSHYEDELKTEILTSCNVITKTFNNKEIIDEIHKLTIGTTNKIYITKTNKCLTDDEYNIYTEIVFELICSIFVFILCYYSA